MARKHIKQVAYKKAILALHKVIKEQNESMSIQTNAVMKLLKDTQNSLESMTM